jgi:sec-independent protein translocase protein TatA
LVAGLAALILWRCGELLQREGRMDLDLPKLIVLLAIVLLLFGARKLPEVARSLGEAIREFKKSMNESAQEKPRKKK